MKLVEFSVTNYRSITTAHKIKLGDLTVLVGKNNEGKSNLLTALNAAMNIAATHSNSSLRNGIHREKPYDWETDFPLQLQSRKNGLESIFKLNFRLDDEELDELHKLLNSKGNRDIPLEIRIGKDNSPKINVKKKGTSSYNRQSKKISGFISKKIYFNYIQAIRTDNMALDVVNETVYSELKKLQNNPTYVDALSTIDQLEQGVLDNISNQLYDPLKTFLPNINSVKVVRESSARSPFSRYYSFMDVIIDDGIATSISTKGDGIKNLVALALLKEKRNFSGASVIAIEEPESHLHSGAIHGLVDVINHMSENNQVIISTHNPLFVQQNRISDNIIVDCGTAKPAKTIGEIRNVLGVLPSDNLENARFVLLVEGEDDKIALSKILPYYSDIIKSALKNNTLVIKPLHGASMLSHDLMDLKNSMCKYVVLLDNDEEGLKAAEKAKSNNLIKDSEIRYTICKGCKYSEFEDCINPSVYKERLSEEFGISLSVSEFKNAKNKWSDRLKDVFVTQGLVWNNNVESKVKTVVADSISVFDGNVEKLVISQKSGFIEGVVKITEKMIEGMK